jgi:hypothetical protein
LGVLSFSAQNRAQVYLFLKDILSFLGVAFFFHILFMISACSSPDALI